MNESMAVKWTQNGRVGNVSMDDGKWTKWYKKEFDGDYEMDDANEMNKQNECDERDMN